MNGFSPLAVRHGRRLAACAALLSLLLLASLCLGAKPIPVQQVIDALAGVSQHPDAVIVREGRLPRTLLGLFCGAALGVAGLLLQALTRNPLADPGILGVNAGASLAVIIGAGLLALQSPQALMLAAFCGALFTTALVYLVGAWGASRIDPLRFVLAGVAIGAVMGGLSSSLVLLDPLTFDRVRYWAAGTLDVRSLTPVLAMAPLTAAGCVLAWLLAQPLNTLGLGHDMALSLGARPRLIQGLCVLAITLLCAASTAVAGPIAFVGLMVPYAARGLAGQDLRLGLPYTVLLAPCLLLSADIIGRLLTAGELRVSVVTAFIGAPALIWLARRMPASGGRA